MKRILKFVMSLTTLLFPCEFLYSVFWYQHSFRFAFCLFQAGLLEEMLEDTFEGMEDQDELEEAAQDEVDKILFEVTSGKSV